MFQYFNIIDLFVVAYTQFTQCNDLITMNGIIRDMVDLLHTRYHYHIIFIIIISGYKNRKIV